MSLPEHIEAWFPHRGPCGICGGPDARHRTFDSIAEKVHAGDSIEDVADDYEVPVGVVSWIAMHWDEHPDA